jgi:tRNA(Ile)-lysidine synthase
MLITKVRETINKHQLLTAGDRVLVAVSGGPDSVCLLSVLNELAKDFNLSLHLAHLDHSFRGSESADEARFASGLAQKFGIPATVERIDVPAYCLEHGLSVQAGAREVRYAFFDRVAASVGAARIATGHTATDQAETMLMRLMRGAGISGLSAIRPKRENIIRPLIEVTREEIVTYLHSSTLPFVSDSSNVKPVYTRNRIRLELLPVLKRFNPSIVETLALEAALLRDEDEAMQPCFNAIASSVYIQKDDSVQIKRSEFNALHPAYKRRLLRKAVDLSGGDSSQMSAVQIEQVLAFMAYAQTGRTMMLTRGLMLAREYDQYLVTTAGKTEVFYRVVAVPGLTAIPELRMEIEIIPGDARTPVPEGGNYRWQAMFDYDKIGTLLTVRNRRPGDVFCPSGMGGRHKKLQDYLVDKKISRLQRDRIPLLCAGDDIVWVVGLRADARYLPDGASRRMIIVRVRAEHS